MSTFSEGVKVILNRRGQGDPKFDNIVRDFAQGFELALCNRA